MNKENDTRVCPVEKAGGLDNPIRKFLQNPQKFLKPYIKKGMTVLDLGCGPGVFTLEIAKMLGGSGKVIAADLQQGMLDKVAEKIIGTDLEKMVVLHKTKADEVGVAEKVDFVLAVYMIHEVPDQDKLFKELSSILNTEGKILIVEPNFHVEKEAFERMVDKLKSIGFEVLERPKMLFSRTVVVRKKQENNI